ncbi:MAG: hypothetical protein RR946_12065, partial [Clostridia bacterium]
MIARRIQEKYSYGNRSALDEKWKYAEISSQMMGYATVYVTTFVYTKAVGMEPTFIDAKKPMIMEDFESLKPTTNKQGIANKP